MTNLELEALRRQVEEDFKLDMAAIERLQRRYNEVNTNSSKAVTAPVEPQPVVETRKQPAIETQKPSPIESRGLTKGSAVDLRPQPPDELTESLRTMFSNYK
jgi:hypothetical protein